jgi:hypothetical protein
VYIRFASLRTGLCALAAALALFVGCSSPHDNALAEYSRWYDGAVAQAQAGALAWSQFYQQSFDRLTALPSSLQQDARLESTVLMLSLARKYEAQEIGAQQFALERTQLETDLQARLR